MKLTQKDRILYELREAGEAGVRGDRFLALSMPRYAARVLELRQEGFDIRSKDDDGMARYRLYGAVGNGTGAGGKTPKESLLETPEVEKVCAVSDSQRGVGEGAEGVRTPVAHCSLPGDPWGAPSLAPQEARLFALPSMSAITDSEAA